MTRYRYNGIELPALPEYDKPYALITRHTDGSYRLSVINKKPIYSASTTRSPKVYYDCVHFNMNDSCSYTDYALSDGAWVEATTATAIGRVFAFNSVSDSSEKRELVWSNFDVFDSDNGIYFAASDPIPVPTLDPTSMLQGWIVGRRIAAQRGKREPVAYLYNGVRLPKLPEWDKTVYPYAWIIEESGIITGDEYHYFYLECFPEQPKRNILGSFVTDSGAGTQLESTYRKVIPDYKGGGSDTDWGEFEEKAYSATVATSSYPPVWSSFDVLNHDGTVYLAASDPVPVYE